MEMDSNGFVTVGDGFFKVNREGKCLRNYHGEWQEATYRRYNDCLVSVAAIPKPGCMETRLLHRLVAEAFVPRKEGADRVIFIDGDKRNIAPENMKWVTTEEISSAVGSNRKLHTKGYRCSVCGKPIADTVRIKDGMCYKCRKEHYRAMKKSKPRLDMSKLSYLKQPEFEIMYAWAHRHPMQEIGDMRGVSRQRIHQIVHRVLDRHYEQFGEKLVPDKGDIKE